MKFFEESGNPSTSFNFDEKFSMGIANRIKFDRSNVPFYLPKLCLNSKLFEEGRDRNASVRIKIKILERHRREDLNHCEDVPLTKQKFNLVGKAWLQK